jgi:putative ABC transport system ATP-binding protein
MAPKETLVLETSNLRYRYTGEKELVFPDLMCRQGEHMLITGKSGVGKTTLLHLLGGLRRVQEGALRIKGEDLAAMNNKERDKFRGEHIGFILQQPLFIQSVDAFENVLTAQYFGKGKTDREFAEALMGELDIAGLRNKKTSELSGGERQRLSIARALSTKPYLVLADEPTSSLDDENAEKVVNLLIGEAEQNDATLIIVTHDSRLKNHFKNHVQL